MKHRTHNIRYVVALITPMACLACDGASPQSSGQTQGLHDVEIGVIGVERGPPGTTQAVLRFVNSASGERTFKGLFADVELRDERDSIHRLHDISLGMSKPIVLPGNETITVPLLFEGEFKSITSLSFMGTRAEVAR